MAFGQAAYTALLVLVHIKYDHATQRIIHGVDSTIERWPFLIQMTYKNTFCCAGSIIANRWVLTAAHCFTHANLPPLIAHYKLYTGSNASNNGTTHILQTINIHEKFFMDDDKTLFDIALVQIKGAFLYTQTLQVIKLDFAEKLLDTDYKNCSIAGWGKRYFTQAREEALGLNLQEMDVETVPHEDCEKVFPGTILRSNVCVRGLGNGVNSSACSGDSGGPFVCGGVLVGVISFGEEFCEGLSAFTKVASYYPWIRSVMRRNKKIDDLNSSL